MFEKVQNYLNRPVKLYDWRNCSSAVMPLWWAMLWKYNFSFVLAGFFAMAIGFVLAMKYIEEFWVAMPIAALWTGAIYWLIFNKLEYALKNPPSACSPPKER
jgi:hypothetical protein